jgi:hypothetical protein
VLTPALRNGAGQTEWIDPAVRQFHDRPFRVIGAERFATALRRTIRNPSIATLRPIGVIDQFADNTSLLTTSLCATSASASYAPVRPLGAPLTGLRDLTQ